MSDGAKHGEAVRREVMSVALVVCAPGNATDLKQSMQVLISERAGAAHAQPDRAVGAEAIDAWRTEVSLDGPSPPARAQAEQLPRIVPSDALQRPRVQRRDIYQVDRGFRWFRLDRPAAGNCMLRPTGGMCSAADQSASVRQH
jgi:hypothetical protein